MKIQIIKKTLGTGRIRGYEAKVLIDGQDITKNLNNIQINLNVEHDIPVVNLTLIPEEVEVDGELEILKK